jgi:hypothetical protein
MVRLRFGPLSRRSVITATVAGSLQMGQSDSEKAVVFPNLPGLT